MPSPSPLVKGDDQVAEPHHFNKPHGHRCVRTAVTLLQSDYVKAGRLGKQPEYPGLHQYGSRESIGETAQRGLCRRNIGLNTACHGMACDDKTSRG